MLLLWFALDRDSSLKFIAFLSQSLIYKLQHCAWAIFPESMFTISLLIFFCHTHLPFPTIHAEATSSTLISSEVSKLFQFWSLSKVLQTPNEVSTLFQVYPIAFLFEYLSFRTLHLRPFSFVPRLLSLSWQLQFTSCLSSNLIKPFCLFLLKSYSSTFRISFHERRWCAKLHQVSWANCHLPCS